MSILEDHKNDVIMRNRELEVVTINGRLATEAVRLAESVYSQIRISPFVKPSKFSVLSNKYSRDQFRMLNVGYSNRSQIAECDFAFTLPLR